MQAQDPAGNIGDSPPVTARIDNTPPGRVDVSVEGGEAWRNRNDFAVAWANPPEPDRAPIAGASYKLCSVGAGNCSRGEQAGGDISRFGVPVPAPGEWTLSLWRRDAAGNETEDAASVPVSLRYDPEPPQLGFEAPSATDPTLVAAPVTDKCLGLAGGAIEISPTSSGIWQTLPTETGRRSPGRPDRRRRVAGRRLSAASARVRPGEQRGLDRPPTRRPADDAHPPASDRLEHASRVRARANRPADDPAAGQAPRDSPAGNGDQAVGACPLGRAGAGSGAAGQPGRHGIAGAEVSVHSSSPVSPEQLVAVLQTDAEGRYRYTAAGSTSRSLRFAFAGSPLVLPAQRTIQHERPGEDLAAREPRPRAERAGRHVHREAHDTAGIRDAASSSSCRHASLTAGRRSAPHAPTPQGGGRSGTASSARAACSDSASAHDCRARRAIPSPLVARAR